MFEGIVFVRGSPIEMSDLRRAGIYRAKQVKILLLHRGFPPPFFSLFFIVFLNLYQVIVLANSKAVDELGHNGVNTEGANRSLEALADVDVIFTFQCVRKMNERANIIIEIVHTNNISYLDFEERQVKSNYKFSPQFASGMLFPTSLLDTLGKHSRIYIFEISLFLLLINLIFIYLFIYSFIHLFIYLSIYSFIYLSLSIAIQSKYYSSC